MSLRTAFRFLLPAAMALTAPAQTMNDLFNDGTLHEIRITIHPSDWRTLRENFLDDTYYPAIFEWRGRMIEDIGIRSRGKGSRSSLKPGLKVDFNRFAPGQEFLGLKSLVLDNLVQDQTMIRERLAMNLFRRMGLAAPRVAHVRLLVNGADAGLYSIVESVDKGFLKRSLGDDSGHLYDYEWAFEYWFESLGDDPAAYSPVPFQLQTNESSPDPLPLMGMIRAINESPDSAFLTDLSRYVDPRHVLTYLAVEAFLAEADGFTGEWGLNNFYLYGARNGRFVLIPWDKDVTFHAITRSVYANVDRNLLTRRLLAIPAMKAYFASELLRAAELAGGPGGWLEQQINNAAAQVRNAAAADPNKPFTYAQFEEGITYLGRFAFERPWVVAGELAGGEAYVPESE